MGIIVLTAAVLFLAWSNGANDNFKGVATLWGSGTASFKTALIWATASTLVGSLVTVLIAPKIARIFSGKGLLQDAAIDPALLAAIGAAGATTVFLATFLHMPTSTTHALTGALVGAGLMAGGGINWGLLLSKFAQPLLLSPIIAIAGTAIFYRFFRWGRHRLGLKADSCICVEQESPLATPLPAGSGAMIVAGIQPAGLTVTLGEECAKPDANRLMGVRAQPVVDGLHYLSAGAVCFARAVNDTPKIAALLLAAGAFFEIPPTPSVLVLVAVAMTLGGWLQSRKVAQTMSQKITSLNSGQGLTANLITAGLVLGASRLGLPVSTTHVSCGSIFGIGLATKNGNRSTILQILTAWVTTLPAGLLLGAVFYLTFRAIGL